MGRENDLFLGGLVLPANIDHAPRINETITCPHGIPTGGMCSACALAAQDHQLVWQQRIPGLLQKGSLQYGRDGLVTSTLTSVETGATFSVEIASPEDSQTVETVYSLLKSTFGPDELADLDVMRNSWRGITPYGTPTPGRNRLFVLRDEDGIIQSLLTVGNIDVYGEDGNPTGETAMLRGYSYSNPALRRTGFARELHISALQYAALLAQQQGKDLRLVGSEAVTSAEPAWNSVGLKRVYRPTPIGNGEYSLDELPYVQPALRFDSQTGEVSEAADVPEHLMVDGLGANIGTDDVLKVVTGFYVWNNRKPIEAFNGNRGAWQKNLAYVGQRVSALRSFLAGGESPVFVSKQERELMQGSGIIFNEHIT